MKSKEQDIYGRKTYPNNPCNVCGGIQYPHEHSSPQSPTVESWEERFDEKFYDADTNGASTQTIKSFISQELSSLTSRYEAQIKGLEEELLDLTLNDTSED